MVQPPLSTIGIAFLTALLSLSITKWCLNRSGKLGLIDVPNDRSSHTRPTPRGGGVGLVCGVAIAFAIAFTLQWLPLRIAPLLLPILIMATVGWWDDRHSLSAAIRFIVQIVLASCGFAWLLYTFPSSGSSGWLFPSSWPFLLSAPFFVLFSVWLTNLYNFMDGIDGIAGLQTATISFAAVLLLWPDQQTSGLGYAFLALGSAAAGFLVLNWHPARIFMGDVGSAFIGFLFSLLAIQGELSGAMPFVVSLILHGAFISDATLTLIVRIFHGQKPHHAHRTHLYQRLVHCKELSHSVVSLIFAATNIFWLLPIAWAALRGLIPGQAALVLAYTPLIGIGLWLKAGIPFNAKQQPLAALLKDSRLSINDSAHQHSSQTTKS